MHEMIQSPGKTTQPSELDPLSPRIEISPFQWIQLTSFLASRSPTAKLHFVILHILYLILLPNVIA